MYTCLLKVGNSKCNGFFEIPVSVFCGQLEIVISHNISKNQPDLGKRTSSFDSPWWIHSIQPQKQLFYRSSILIGSRGFALICSFSSFSAEFLTLEFENLGHMTSQRIFKNQFRISEQSSIRFRGQIYDPSGAVRLRTPYPSLLFSLGSYKFPI